MSAGRVALGRAGSATRLESSRPSTRSPRRAVTESPSTCCALEGAPRRRSACDGGERRRRGPRRRRGRAAGDAGGAATAGAAAAPAAAAPAAAAPAAPAAARRPPYVAGRRCAASRSRRGPCPSSPLLPVWALVYAGTLEPPSRRATDPLAEGEELYARQLRRLPRRHRRRRRRPGARRRRGPRDLPEPEDHVAVGRPRRRRVADDAAAPPTATPTRGRPARHRRLAAMPAFGDAHAPRSSSAVVRYEREMLVGRTGRDRVVTDGARHRGRSRTPRTASSSRERRPRAAERRRRRHRRSSRLRRAAELPCRHGDRGDARPPATTSSSSAAGRRARPPRYWLAEAGHDVVVVEQKTFPARRRAATGSRPGRCSQLDEMGLDDRARRELPPLRRPAGRRPRHHPRAAVARAPRLPVARLRRAPPRPRPAGGRPRGEGRAPRCDQGTEAVAPIARGRPRARRGGRRTRRRGEHREIRGPLRGRGRRRQLPLRPGPRHLPQPHATRRAWPSAATTRARCTTTRGSSRALDVRDRNGNSLPGYGWIFPVGDGTINVGIGLLSTFRDWK